MSNWKPDKQDMAQLRQMLELSVEDPAWKLRLIEHVEDMCHNAFKQGDDDARDMDSRDESDTYDGLFR